MSAPSAPHSSKIMVKLGVAGIAALLIGAAGLGVTACCACPPVAPTSVIVCPYDGGEVGPEEAFETDRSEEALALLSPCARACKSFSLLQCPESKKLPGGRSCLDSCKAILAISSFNPECVALAKTVAAVRTCPQVKCETPAPANSGG